MLGGGAPWDCEPKTPTNPSGGGGGGGYGEGALPAGRAGMMASCFWPSCQSCPPWAEACAASAALARRLSCGGGPPTCIKSAGDGTGAGGCSGETRGAPSSARGPGVMLTGDGTGGPEGSAASPSSEGICDGDAAGLCSEGSEAGASPTGCFTLSILTEALLIESRASQIRPFYRAA